MPEATLSSFKLLLDDASELSDALLEKVLASALRKVQKDGVAVTHESFADLQEYYAASILESTGNIRGPLASKSVADVSESYNTTTAATKGYRGVYLSTLRDVIGKRGFIV
ncbi:MAG: hypothetical protein FWH53_00810 [Leptospirales bacterium]|nr:hypothetical protein [Leptospirales bacterium]